MLDHALLHYDEIGTKGGNRRRFEERLLGSVVRMLHPFGEMRPRRETGRIVFSLASVPEDRREAALRAVARLPGVAWVTAAVRTAPTLEAVTAAVLPLAARRTGSFKITARRTDKELPFDSLTVMRTVGAAVQAATGRRVDVHTPDDTYRIELDRDTAYVFDARHQGPGGLPVTTAGRVVALLSGGLDSPVAAYRMMLRGCEVAGVHLWNRSFSGEGVREKLLDLGRALARHQAKFRLNLVPFDDLQRAIVAAAPADVRMLLYRRAMLAVADDFVRAGHYEGIVLGDAVSQVASQTLPNLAAVYPAAKSLVLTPLIGQCKAETIALAQRIGTYDISIRPGADCCGLLVPKHPRTKSDAAELAAIEASYDLPRLVADAVAAREVHEFHGTID